MPLSLGLMCLGCGKGIKENPMLIGCHKRGCATGAGDWVIGCQWAPLSRAAEDETGPVGNSLLGGALARHSVSCCQLQGWLSMVFMRASGRD